MSPIHMRSRSNRPLQPASYQVNESGSTPRERTARESSFQPGKRDKNAKFRETSDDEEEENEIQHVSTLPEQEHEKEIPRYRPIFTIDWRSEICRLLEISSEISNEELFEAMDEASKKLQEIDHLRSQARAKQGPPRFQVIHSVRCSRSSAETRLYLDRPWVVETGPYDAHLRGSRPVNSFDLYIERNKEIIAIVYKRYECCATPLLHPPQGEASIETEIDASVLLQSEHISITSNHLRSSMADLAKVSLEGIPYPNFEDESETIGYPYTWWFHRRTKIDATIKTLPAAALEQINAFRCYILDRMSEEWAKVDALISKDKIAAKYMDYVFVPNEIVISKTKENTPAQLRAFVIEGWLKSRQLPDGSEWSLDVHHWSFDGSFQRESEELTVGHLPSETDEFDIGDLSIYPARFASDTVIEALQKRGRMFWKCRVRNYVSRRMEETDEIPDLMESRYMVDIATYRNMHRDSDPCPISSPTPDRLDPEYMLHDDPELGDEFFMCLPTTIPGFNMDKKKWENLDVYYLEDVKWNTEAFDFLVIDEETKELIQAVVTNRIRTPENADLIRGKGNGLFILLHGGPGTGKTLTAESVAEIAKKPLYRVTCGDIGTRAEDVERYLEVVLRLGKTWGCVVLLDEADIFLEQRTLVNLERNALVSVFLRVLEYYDGILILTSNRVGVFDEAFRSRIQLNLRYKNLERDQRLNIWKNFLLRLERLEAQRIAAIDQHAGLAGYGINTVEIGEKLETLADASLNGRQIRNAVSTARQLAKYRRQPLAYSHLESVIGEARKFDEYLLDLQKGFTADEIQWDKSER